MDTFVNNESHNVLLRSLHKAVVAVLSVQPSSGTCWSIVGSLPRILTPTREILLNGLRDSHYDLTTSKKYCTFWPFVSRMRHLNTIYSAGMQQCERIESIADYKERADIWLDSSLRTFNIANPLEMLLNNRDHVTEYYEEGAFMMSEQYTKQMIVCFQALECNKIEMLASIDSRMLVENSPVEMRPSSSRQHNRRGHQRSSSYPVYANSKDFVNAAEERSRELDTSVDLEQRLVRQNSRTEQYDDDLTTEPLILSTDTLTSQSDVLIRRGTYTLDLEESVGADISSTAILSSSGNNYLRKSARGHVRSSSDACLHSYTKPAVQFSRPLEGQSLLSFLKSQDFKTCAELDKENSHFNISEALISAIEQMRCNTMNNRSFENAEVESDDEIEGLKQRLRIRRSVVQKQKAANFLVSDIRDNVSLATSLDVTSASPASSSSLCSASSSIDSFTTIDDIDINDSNANLASISASGINLSMASLYSEIDLNKNNRRMEKKLQRQNSTDSTQSYNQSNDTAAEMVALSLLRRFNDKQLPKASDLNWLVSEQDAPQTLLPLPDSVPISPGDDFHILDNSTRIRGELDWAPPRAQIIFNIQPKPRRKLWLEKQNWRCAGCGARVEVGFHGRYRYCSYTGKYYCPRCHSNHTATIPARILRKWDFNRYLVSNFARDLLIRLHDQPLYNMADLRPSWFSEHHSAKEANDMRLRIAGARLFLVCCRKASRLYEEMQQLPEHWFHDVDLYSVRDLEKVKDHSMVGQLRKLFTDAVAHINNCELCQAKGFFCELCKNRKDVLFPFNSNIVYQCPECNSCFHIKCKIENYCPKCNRIENRRKIEKGRMEDNE